MAKARATEPKGGKYTRYFASWIRANGFGDMPHSARHCAMQISENEKAVLKWMGSLPPTNRPLVYPATPTCSSWERRHFRTIRATTRPVRLAHSLTGRRMPSARSTLRIRERWFDHAKHAFASCHAACDRQQRGGSFGDGGRGSRQGQGGVRDLRRLPLTRSGPARSGPTLHDLFGRKSATEEFSYSAAMRRTNITWTPELLDTYLADPQGGMFRGNRMPFSGLPDAQERADLIAYLKQATK